MARLARPPRARAARRRTAAPAFNALTVEGALIASAQLALVAGREAGGQDEADYRVHKGLTLRDEIARYFRIGQALFADFAAADPASHPAAVRFAQALLRDVLGFPDIAPAPRREEDGRVHPVTLEALGGRAPVVVVPRADTLDAASSTLAAAGRRTSAALALQDWLNASEPALWGLACNGERLRLVRDNASLTRPAYIEADLRRIFEGEAFADFTALWLLMHASRFGPPAGEDGRIPAPADCSLERWRDAGQKAGLAARDRLRVGVEQALQALGTGFLAHRANGELRRRLVEGELALQAFHGRLLRLVYRMIFLLVAEDRGLLHPPDTAPAPRVLYAEGYSLSRLRERAVRRLAWDAHDDLWDGMLIVFDALATRGEPALGLPGLDGLFAPGTLGELEAAALPNRALMEAVYRLGWLREDGALVPVNWRDMETEELGSVYESLLELTPRLADDGRAYAFAEGAETRGNARKTTGSYYTPDSLVQVLLDSALDPVLDAAEHGVDEPAAALLSVTVIDPACGSGHFLLAAARRIATRVARARSGGTASAEQYRHALRDVARACIHGVDRNPMAVELTKVALWIETVEPGKPLGFLDASIRCGDALLGVFDLTALNAGIPDAAYKPLSGDDKEAAKVVGKVNRQQRANAAQGDLVAHLSQQSLARAAAAVAAMPEDDVDALARKAQAHERLRAQEGWGARKLACDLYVSAFLRRKAFRADGLARAQTPDRIPTTLDVRTALTGGQGDARLVATAVNLAEEARAFHWPLEFPAAMGAGGFDVVLGNPPWERIKLQEQEFFAPLAPEIAEAPNAAARGRLIAALAAAEPDSRERALYDSFEQAKRTAEAASVFARVPAEEGGRFPLTGRGDVNTYALFAELFSKLASPRGRAGVIVPTGIATDATTAPFFRSLVESERVSSLFSFFEIRLIFPATDDRNSFCLLSIGPQREGGAEFAFQLGSTAQLDEPERRFTLTPADIARINPNTKTAPVFRSREDARLTAKIYDHVPVLMEKARHAAGDPWGLSFMAMFHMSNDSGLFRTAAQLADEGLVREGPDWVDEGGGDRRVPLQEAKLIHQFDHRWATYDGVGSRDATAAEKADPAFEPAPRYWVPAAEVEARLVPEEPGRRAWTRDWLIGWRRNARSPDERTMICSVLPRQGVGDSIFLMDVASSSRELAALLGNLDALIHDFVVRQKVSGINMSFYFVEQFPLLPPCAYTPNDLAFIVPRVLELTYTSGSLQPFARDLGYDGEPFPWDEDRRARLRAELDAWYARAYGLTRDELRYVLDPADVMGGEYPSETFRVLEDKEVRRLGEYRTRRLVLEAWDAQESANTTPFEIEWSALPAAAWTRPAVADATALRFQTQAQIAAVVKALPGATPAAIARLAAAYALEPHLLTARLEGAERAQWLRLVGPEAQPRDGAVLTFGLGGATGWAAALSQLQGGGALQIDPAADTWGPLTTGLDGYITEGWPARAGFALRAARRLLADDSASLSAEETAGVRALAA